LARPPPAQGRRPRAPANQVIGQIDLVFPGLDRCFSDLLGARSGRVIITDICDPDRIRRLGSDGPRRFVARRAVALSGPKAAQVVGSARVALRLPAAERAVLGRVLATDVALLNRLDAEIIPAEAALGEVLADTPAGILTSLPGVAVVAVGHQAALLAGSGATPGHSRCRPTSPRRRPP
jgi:hypothetical protein